MKNSNCSFISCPGMLHFAVVVVHDPSVNSTQHPNGFLTENTLLADFMCSSSNLSVYLPNRKW